MKVNPTAPALIATAMLVSSCATMPGADVASPGTVVKKSVALPVAEVQWEHLNPARGDNSPAAATLWGDRNGTEATGFLVRFVDGFESPPHIHNVSYRGVVIDGLVHNDDPKAEPMWMPAGSYWTQPLGGAHITSASGGGATAYIEIDEGPYLVRPVDEASVGDEHPVNTHASNLVWLDFSTLGWDAAPEERVHEEASVAFLWGDPNTDQTHGLLVQLPAGATAAMGTPGSTFRAVVIEGELEHKPSSHEAPLTLTPGSYLSVSEGAEHLSCADAAPCILYVRAEGRFEAALHK